MAADALNVHSYDGQLAIQHLAISPHLLTLSLEEKRHLASSLLPLLADEARNILTTLIAGMGTAANHDPTNNLLADDLLVLCTTFRANTDFLRELELQLLDMRTGMCPQGRTHRLYQLLLAFGSK